jgi:DNA-binding CsgD family transcriptional regulator
MKNGFGRVEALSKIRLSEGVATFAAFDTALSMIPQPTFVIDGGGQILHANGLGKDVLRQEWSQVRRSLVQAAGGQPGDLAWRITALESGEDPAEFIAVLEPEAQQPAGGRGRRACVRQWNLTARQVEVLDLVAGGATNAAVAEELGIKERTVEFHLSAIFDKAGVDNRATLIARLLAL